MRWTESDTPRSRSSRSSGTRDEIARYAERLEFCVRNNYSADEFVERCKEEGLSTVSGVLHVDLYRELVKLDDANKNSLRTRIIKNAFAPRFVELFNFVAGNPPWVRWGFLPPGYREDTKQLWKDYGLFTKKGLESRGLHVGRSVDRALAAGPYLGV